MEPQKQISDASQQTADEKGLAEFIKKRVEDVRSTGNRIAHEGVWMTNTAYLLGFDSVYYDTTNRQFRSVDGAASSGLRRNRVFENLILPAVQNRQARLCKQSPKFEIRPEDNSNEAKEAARLGREVLLQLWDECDVNLKRLPLTMWLQQCGHAYMHIAFDDELGAPLYDPMSGDFLGYEGKILVEPVSAFEIFADPLATTLDEAQWMVRAKVRKLDYFRTRYPERGGLVKEEGAWLLSIQYEQRIQSLTSTGMSSANSAIMMENSAIELSYYEKRSRKHPQGRHVIIANGVVLKDAPLPVGEIPYAKFDDVLIAGKYYSEATITHARPLQDQYNKTLTRRAKWTNALLAGKYIAARGHGLAPEALDDQSGEVVEYDPVANAAPPTAMQLPVIPSYAYTETDQLKKSLYDIFGLSEVSRGQLPSASIPAVGMQLLIEQDETRIAIEVEQHEHAYARVGTLMLLYAAKFFKTDRNLAEKNANSEMVIRKFSGKDLPQRPDVKVVRGSTVPTSSALRKQDVMNAYQNGLLGNPQDPMVQERVLEMMEFGNNEGLWEDSALDANQARREILMIEKGEQPPIDKFDNHAFILRKLNNYRKSDKFMDLPPEAQQMLLAVRDERARILSELSNPQIEQMQANVDDGMSAVEGEPLLDEIQPEGEAVVDPMAAAPLE
jgi:hypothetical protein